jgi:hypothetical protein
LSINLDDYRPRREPRLSRWRALTKAHKATLGVIDAMPTEQVERHLLAAAYHLAEARYQLWLDEQSDIGAEAAGAALVGGAA